MRVGPDRCSCGFTTDAGVGHAYNEEGFQYFLEVERQCSELSHRPLLLMLVDLMKRSGVSPMIEPVTARQIFFALGQALRETDFLGWYQHGLIAGAVLPQAADNPRMDASRVVSARVEEILQRALPSEVASRVRVRVHQLPLTGKQKLAVADQKLSMNSPHVVSEKVFKCALVRERKRTLSARSYVCSDPKDGAEVPSVDAVLTSLEVPSTRAAIGVALKLGLDILGSFTLLLVLSPLLALIALLLKARSPGPILFKQVRVGEKMKPFTMLKFRTMQMNVDHTMHQAFVTRFIRLGGQTQEPGENRTFKITNDPRVTRIGRVLRRTSLDELPQLWNVLRGDMSLVGPRPPLLYEVEQYERWHRRRVLEAKPGITGLWQVKGRSRTTFDDMVRLDLRYARSRSVWTDLKILFVTPGAVVAGKGAC